MSFPFSARKTTRFGVLAENPRVSAAVLVDTVGAGLLLPLSLVYFTLTSGLGLAEIGLIAAIATVVALPAGMAGGAITDRFGAKASMVTNNLVSAVGYTLFLFVHDPVGIFCSDLSDRSVGAAVLGQLGFIRPPPGRRQVLREVVLSPRSSQDGGYGRRSLYCRAGSRS